jgi:uncharacterized membrane protein YfcA
MSKKTKNNSEQGTYAICITAGLIVGIGMGPVLDNVLLSAAAGILLGIGAGYIFTHQKKKKQKRR